MKTLVLLGNGAKSESNLIREWIEFNNLPVVYSMNGKGVISDNHPHVYGMIGSWGKANQLLQECEQLIIVGSRLDVRQLPDRSILDNKVIHIINSNININNSIVYATFKYFVKSFHGNFSIWCCNRPKFNEIETLINKISIRLHKYYITTDVGENQLICANSWNVDSKFKFITSGGLGTMGFAIPAAIGIATQKLPVVAVCGDGGFQMNIQELETIKYYKLPIKIIVINNNRLKLVSDFQKLNNLNTITTIEGYSCPNIRNISKAYGIKYFKNVNKFLRYNKSCILEINQGE